MKSLNIDKLLINWVIDFLMQRKQRVKLNSALSDWPLVNGGVPQGTILGPLLFLIMVNDLAIYYRDRWKYVDDTSLSEQSEKAAKGFYNLLLMKLINGVRRMIWCLTTPSAKT